MLRVIFYQCSRLLSFSAPKCLLHPSGESGERVIFHLAALKQTLVMDGFSKKVFDTFPYVAKFDDEVERFWITADSPLLPKLQNGQQTESQEIPPSQTTKSTTK